MRPGRHDVDPKPKNQTQTVSIYGEIQGITNKDLNNLFDNKFKFTISYQRKGISLKAFVRGGFEYKLLHEGNFLCGEKKIRITPFYSYNNKTVFIKSGLYIKKCFNRLRSFGFIIALTENCYNGSKSFQALSFRNVIEKILGESSIRGFDEVVLASDVRQYYRPYTFTIFQIPGLHEEKDIILPPDGFKIDYADDFTRITLKNTHITKFWSDNKEKYSIKIILPFFIYSNEYEFKHVIRILEKNGVSISQRNIKEDEYFGKYPLPDTDVFTFISVDPLSLFEKKVIQELKTRHIVGQLYEFLISIAKDEEEKLKDSSNLFKDLCELVGDYLEDLIVNILVPGDENNHEKLCDEIYEKI